MLRLTREDLSVVPGKLVARQINVSIPLALNAKYRVDCYWEVSPSGLAFKATGEYRMRDGVWAFDASQVGTLSVLSTSPPVHIQELSSHLELGAVGLHRFELQGRLHVRQSSQSGIDIFPNSEAKVLFQNNLETYHVEAFVSVPAGNLVHLVGGTGLADAAHAVDGIMANNVFLIIAQNEMQSIFLDRNVHPGFTLYSEVATLEPASTIGEAFAALGSSNNNSAKVATLELYVPFSFPSSKPPYLEIVAAAIEVVPNRFACSDFTLSAVLTHPVNITHTALCTATMKKNPNLEISFRGNYDGISKRWGMHGSLRSAWKEMFAQEWMSAIDANVSAVVSPSGVDQLAAKARVNVNIPLLGNAHHIKTTAMLHSRNNFKSFYAELAIIPEEKMLSRLIRSVVPPSSQDCTICYEVFENFNAVKASIHIASENTNSMVLYNATAGTLAEVERGITVFAQVEPMDSISIFLTIFGYNLDIYNVAIPEFNFYHNIDVFGEESGSRRLLRGRNLLDWGFGGPVRGELNWKNFRIYTEEIILGKGWSMYDLFVAFDYDSFPILKGKLGMTIQAKFENSSPVLFFLTGTVQGTVDRFDGFEIGGGMLGKWKNAFGVNLLDFDNIYVVFKFKEKGGLTLADTQTLSTTTTQYRTMELVVEANMNIGATAVRFMGAFDLSGGESEVLCFLC